VSERVRLDRWLWAARLFRTRSQAKQAIDAGHVEVDGHKGKPGKEIGPGSTVSVRRGTLVTTLMVDGLAERRGSAVLAAALYTETPESVELRETEKARRRMEAAGLRIPPQRPDKRDRRARQRLKQESGEPE
jgi:ribosome-associated heat shock protein Hsp15